MIDWKEAALAHAQSVFPAEACGLVVVCKGRLRYVPCRNIASRAEDEFTIDPQDYASAEELGEVVQVFHSHPNASARPSSSDLCACRASGLTWSILSLPLGEWSTTEPDDRLDSPLYGREFVHGLHDCYSFVRSWYLQERHVNLPDYPRDDEWWRKGGNLYLENFSAAGFERVTGTPEPGDVLLMQVHADVPNHAAVYLGDEQIGHHVYGRLSSREVYGGYWRKHTTHTLRYRGHAT